MNRRTLVAFLALSVTPLAVIAGPITVTINTPTVPAGAVYLDLQFNPFNSPLSAVATLTDFQQSGYAFGATDSSTGVTGSFEAPPLVIPNDQGLANFYTRAVTTFGTSFTFTLNFSGPAVGGGSTDSSEFFVFLEDSDFSPLFGTLDNGAIATVLLDGKGGITTQDGNFGTDGSTLVTASAAVPEPATFALGALGIGVLAFLRRRD